MIRTIGGRPSRVVQKTIYLVGILLLANSPFFPTMAASSIEGRSGPMRLQVLLGSDGLKPRTETYTFRLQTLAGQPFVGKPTVRVSMPMSGSAPMVAPTSVIPIRTPGLYSVKTEFTMAGVWTLQVQPDPSLPPIRVSLPVTE
jgi:hypothetical protein